MREPTIAAHLAARTEDDRPGLLFEDRQWSWAEVVAESGRRARLLHALRAEGGLEPFHVGVLLENVPEYVFLLFGAALAGATVVGLNPTRRGAALERDIVHTDCGTVMTDAGGSRLLAGLDLRGAAGTAPPVVTIDDQSYQQRVTAAGPGSEPDPERLPGPATLYLLVFTAGSTGTPKAVRMTQGRAARTAADSAVAFTDRDVLYCAMPLFHGNALLANLFAALVSGASVVLRRRFSASGFLPDVRRYGCTYFNYVGRALSYLLAVPESPDERDHRLKWTLGSEASPRDRAEFTRRFGVPVFEGYGSSENAVVISPVPGTPSGALGKPREGFDVAILDPETGGEKATAVLDDDGRLTNPEEAIGEIVGRNTAGRFEGYYNNPEADAARTRAGCYWTGDLGYRDADGFIWFAGRTADWLRVDGENFSAGAVERIIDRFPGPRGVAVYGVPDPVTGDQVMAALEGAGPDAFDAAAFDHFLAGQPDLGTKWAPRFVRLVDALPVTGTGKLDKAPLRAAAWETPDPVWWRPQAGAPLRPMEDADRAELRQLFARNERAALLPG
ncbi:MAG TPA: AMP-binding protein [Acidimicrobiales bacterium]|nr:AMP-binding protein [Acidimicrobiales bacterium]